MATDPYKLIEDNYQALIDGINAQKQAQEIVNQQRQQQLSDQLTEQNRALNITYNNAINPFGKNAEQRGVMGTGVSEYFKNSAYGTLLQGLGMAQGNYQSARSANDSDWQSFVLKMAGLKDDADTQHNDAILQQQEADRQADLQNRQLAEQQRQFNANLALQQQKVDSGSGSGGSDGVDLGSLGLGGTPAGTLTGGLNGSNYVPRTETMNMVKKAINRITDPWQNRVQPGSSLDRYMRAQKAKMTNTYNPSTFYQKKTFPTRYK